MWQYMFFSLSHSLAVVAAKICALRFILEWKNVFFDVCICGKRFLQLEINNRTAHHFTWSWSSYSRSPIKHQSPGDCVVSCYSQEVYQDDMICLLNWRA